jgi:hypothetical protein
VVKVMVMLMVMLCKIQLERLLSSNSQGPAGPALADMHDDHQLIRAYACFTIFLMKKLKQGTPSKHPGTKPSSVPLIDY